MIPTVEVAYPETKGRGREGGEGRKYTNIPSLPPTYPSTPSPLPFFLTLLHPPLSPPSSLSPPLPLSSSPLPLPLPPRLKGTLIERPSTSSPLIPPASSPPSLPLRLNVISSLSFHTILHHYPRPPPTPAAARPPNRAPIHLGAPAREGHSRPRVMRRRGDTFPEVTWSLAPTPRGARHLPPPRARLDVSLRKETYRRNKKIYNNEIKINK